MTSQSAQIVEQFKSSSRATSSRGWKSERVDVNEVTKVSFDTHHDGGSKVFRATVSVWNLDEHGSWTLTLHNGFKTVAVEPCARYSASKLKNFNLQTILSDKLVEVLDQVAVDYAVVSA